MEVKDNKNEMPLRHYRALLASLDPAAVSGRTGIPYVGGCFRTKLLDRDFRGFICFQQIIGSFFILLLIHKHSAQTL